MKIDIKYIAFLGILFLNTSCFKEVDLEDLRPASKLVLNSVVSQGEPLKASVSRTWFYTEDYPNVSIEDAKVDLYVNDRLVEEMTWNVEETEYYSIGNYVSSYIPASGDKVRIEVKKDGFKEATAEEIVPGKPTLLNFHAESKIEDVYGYMQTRRRFKVTFRDEPSVQNCYLIFISYGTPVYDYEWQNKPPVYTGMYSWRNESIDYSSDPVFGNKISALDKVFGNDWLSGYNGRPFSDELFDGKEYTMTLDGNFSYGYNPSFPQPEERLPDSARVYVYAISEPYYKYLSALATLNDASLNNDLADIGLAEPVRVFSNIEGGVGILGAACVDSITVAILNK